MFQNQSLHFSNYIWTYFVIFHFFRCNHKLLWHSSVWR